MTRKPDVPAPALEALLRTVFGREVEWERTADGSTTPVYRVAGSHYLRVAEEADEDLTTDAMLLDRLAGLGLRVPRVVHVVPFDAGIGRSVLVTTEIPGRPVAAGDHAVPVVMAAAGAELAVLNQQPVTGYGWVRRDGSGWPVRAAHPDYAGFLRSELPEPWPGPLATLFDPAAIDALAGWFDRAMTPAAPRLAHGDFDITPIFQVDGRYTGLIDFGEIRGTEPSFDLGHFLLHDREDYPAALLPALLRGYRTVAAPPDDEEIRGSAVRLGLRQLSRWLARAPAGARPAAHPLVAARVRRLTELL